MSLIDNKIVTYNQIIPELCNKLHKLDKNFTNNAVTRRLKPYIDKIKTDTYVYFEYPYVDKVYRDSYYNYFSMKLRDYDKNCIRVSFFNKEIKYEDFRDINRLDYLRESYCGFLIIRPLLPQLIGRTVIDPRILLVNDFSCCTVKINSMLNGVKLVVEGFPHSSQDSETISCAETTVWSVMEYFGNRYPEYSPVLPSKIIRILEDHSFQRQIPSNGLSILQISTAIKKFGFGARLYSENSTEILKLISYYVDSGIPVIAALKNGIIGHAVVYIGHGNVTDQALNAVTPCINKGDINICDSADIQKDYVVIDDNFPPYQKVNLSTPTSYYTGIDSNFDNCRVVSFVTPLYQKIHLEAFIAKKIIKDILIDDNIGWKSTYSKLVLFRLFLTSSRSFKEKIAQNTTLNTVIKELIINTFMPKFVWVAELYLKEDYINGNASGLIIIDATEPSSNFRKSLILIVYPDKFITYQDNNFKETLSITSKFNKYTNNLKGGF